MKNDFTIIAKHWAIAPDALQSLKATTQQVQADLSLFGQKPLPRSHRATVQNGVAIIPIHGVITPRFDLFTLLMGGTAFDTLTHDLKMVTADNDIRGIILDIDSPGGVAVGTSEIAELIHKVASIKPIWAYVGRTCCSAAYWLASATTKIIAHKSAMIGSIGVVSTVPIQEVPDADGYRQIEIVSNNAKNKRPDPRTPEGLDTIRAELDALETEFIQDIANYRNTDTTRIKTDFGQGGVLLGNAAKRVGMIDEISDFDSCLAAISDLTTTTPKGGKNMSKTEQNAITDEQIATYRAEGAKAERDRLLALDEVAVAGHEDLLAQAKADPNMTAEKLALAIVKAEKATGNAYLDGLKKAEAAMPTVAPTAQPTSAVGATPEERAEHEWQHNADVRREFDGDKEAFVAYFVANENGQLKIQTKGE